MFRFFQYSRFGDLARRVAADDRFGVFHFTNNDLRQHDRNRSFFVKRHFADFFHTVNDILFEVGNGFRIDFVLVEFVVDEDVVRG